MPRQRILPIPFLINNRFISILLPLVALLLTQPLVAKGMVPGLATKVISLLAVLGAYRILRPYRSAVFVCLALLGVAAIAVPAEEVIIGSTAHVIGASAIIAALTIVTIIIAWEAVTEDWVTRDTLLGSLAVYLLIGIIASYVFELIELGLPGSFTNLHGSTPTQVFAELNYYSLVTLTTLGYGDIAPVNELARMLGAMEAIIGQFFVAGVVGLLISRSSSQIAQRTSADNPVPHVE